MKLRKGSAVLACGLAALLAIAATASAASTPSTKKPPRKAHAVAARTGGTPTKSGRCHIGQDTKTCNPNPLFAKDACDTVVGSTMQALANKPIGKGYQPYVTGNGLMCMWRVGGMTQSITLHLYGGPKYTPTVQEFWREMQQFNEDPGSTCPWPSKEAYDAAVAAGTGDQPPLWINPVKTTVEGYPAWVEDGCAAMPQADAAGTPGDYPNFWLWRHVWVLDGDLTVQLDVRDPVATDLTTAQLIPYVEKVMSLYASTK